MEQNWFGISNKILYSIIALILLLWGLSGLQEITRIPYAGYYTSPDSIVTNVQPDSPVADAGLRIGDEVTKIDGIPVESVAGFYESGRPAIGSEGSITIKRGNAQQTLRFRYTERSSSDIMRSSGMGILMGLSCLLLGLLVYLKNPTWRSQVLCLIFYSIAAIALPRPYLRSALWNRLLNSTTSLIAASLVALIVIYCLNFPRAKEGVRTPPWVNGLIVLAALALGTLSAAINILQPNINNITSMFLNLLFGLVYGGLLLWAIFTVIGCYLKTSVAERRRTGLNWMVVGIVIGLLPPVLSILLGLLFPRVGEWPWDGYITILALAMPICFAMALMRLEPAHRRLRKAIMA